MIPPVLVLCGSAACFVYSAAMLETATRSAFLMLCVGLLGLCLSAILAEDA